MSQLGKFLDRITMDRSLAYVSIGNAFAYGVGALIWFYLAAHISVTDFGSLNYQLSIAYVSTAICAMGLDITFTTYVAKGLTTLVPEANSLVVVLTMTFCIGLGLITSSLSLILLLMGMVFFSLSEGELLGKHQYKEFMFLLIVQNTHCNSCSGAPGIPWRRWRTLCIRNSTFGHELPFHYFITTI